MPKKVYKINNFHGGLNNSSDPRDVDDKEITAATNVMVDEVGRVRLTGKNVPHDATVLDMTGAGVTQTPGSGLFYFSHDRKGGEDAGDDEEETNDDYLALYDDSDAQVWVYSSSVDIGGGTGWDDDKDSTEDGVINFVGKPTSAVARPCFFSADGAVRVSTGEFGKYDSGADINMGSHFLITATALTVDDGTVFKIGNYIKIDDEILFASAKPSTHVLTVTRGMFGTKDVQHQHNADIYILNMNQWYDYINNKLFQTSAGVSVYENDKWYNNIQHLRSLDDLGITLALHDANSTSPAAAQINAVNKIIVAYWFTDTKKDIGFWSGTYWIGITPIYQGGQEGPISNVGSSPLQIHRQILNIQLYITHPNIDDTAIVEGDGHPLLDERIIGLKLYTKSYVDDEWFLLKEFDLLEGDEHGWETYNSDAGAAVTSAGGNTLAGFWKTTATADSLELGGPIPSDGNVDDLLASFAENQLVTARLDLEESKGAGRVGTLKLMGYHNSPLYEEVDLNDPNEQVIVFTGVTNPQTGTHRTVVQLLDENFNIMHNVSHRISMFDGGILSLIPGLDDDMWTDP